MAGLAIHLILILLRLVARLLNTPQLEGYDQPRRDAFTDYRKASKEVAEMGEAVTAADIATLCSLAEGLVDAPQPVTLGALVHLADPDAGVKALAEQGVITLDGDTVCLLPDYGSAVNAQVSSLGPVALLMIDCSVEHGNLTYQEFVTHLDLKYGTLHRAMTKLVSREIYDADRDGLEKRFTLRHDWLSAVEAQAHTMRTYGLYQKREITDAKAIFAYCGELLKVAPIEQRPKLERRREKAFTRLMAAVALEAPSLATDIDFRVAMRLSGSRQQAKAPEMPEPSVLARYRLTDLIGKELLTADEYGELQSLAKTLGADLSKANIAWNGEVAYA